MKTEMINNEWLNASVAHITYYWEKKRYRKAISECETAIKLAHEGGLSRKEMELHSLMAMILRERQDDSNAIYHFSVVVYIARNHDLKKTVEYTDALFHLAMLSIKAGFIPPYAFYYVEEAIEVRCAMTDEDHDAKLKSYRNLHILLKRYEKREYGTVCD